MKRRELIDAVGRQTSEDLIHRMGLPKLLEFAAVNIFMFERNQNSDDAKIIRKALNDLQDHGQFIFETEDD